MVDGWLRGVGGGWGSRARSRRERFIGAREDGGDGGRGRGRPPWALGFVGAHGEAVVGGEGKSVGVMEESCCVFFY